MAGMAAFIQISRNLQVHIFSGLHCHLIILTGRELVERREKRASNEALTVSLIPTLSDNGSRPFFFALAFAIRHNVRDKIAHSDKQAKWDAERDKCSAPGPWLDGKGRRRQRYFFACFGELAPSEVPLRPTESLTSHIYDWVADGRYAQKLSCFFIQTGFNSRLCPLTDILHCFEQKCFGLISQQVPIAFSKVTFPPEWIGEKIP